MNEHTNVNPTAQEERLGRLFATWNLLVQTQGAGHDVHSELNEVIRAVFAEIGDGAGVGVGTRAR